MPREKFPLGANKAQQNIEMKEEKNSATGTDHFVFLDHLIHCHNRLKRPKDPVQQQCG